MNKKVEKAIFVLKIMCSIGLLLVYTILLYIHNTISYEKAAVFEKTPRSNLFIIMEHNHLLGYLSVFLGILLSFIIIIRSFLKYVTNKKMQTKNTEMPQDVYYLGAKGSEKPRSLIKPNIEPHIFKQLDRLRELQKVIAESTIEYDKIEKCFIEDFFITHLSEQFNMSAAEFRKCTKDYWEYKKIYDKTKTS